MEFPSQQDVNEQSKKLLLLKHNINQAFSMAQSLESLEHPSAYVQALNDLKAARNDLIELATVCEQLYTRAYQLGQIIDSPLNQLRNLEVRIDQAKAEFLAYVESIADQKARIYQNFESEKKRLDEEVSAHKVRVAERVAELTEAHARELFSTWRDRLRRFIFDGTATKDEVDEACDELRYALRLLPKGHALWQEIQVMSESVE
jgi:chromosome segregation ATPase